MEKKIEELKQLVISLSALSTESLKTAEGLTATIGKMTGVLEELTSRILAVEERQNYFWKILQSMMKELNIKPELWDTKKEG